MKTINAKITFPSMEERGVWAGMYGGPYDVIVFFHTKPLLGKETNNVGKGEKFYDLIDNKDKIAGAMWLDDFIELTGIKLKPESIDIVKLHKMNLTAIWNNDNTLKNYPFNADGWI